MSKACYGEEWEKIDKRPVPSWFDDAKFGIFIHWGVYSVPAWAPKRKDVVHTGEAYAEWYGKAMNDAGGPYWKFHRDTYGEKAKYQDFAPGFTGELFDPHRWAELFRKSGARYVTLTAKHHDGFCLWPSQYSWNWNSVDIGSHRDLAGELAGAVRAEGLRMGFYYSLMEWYRPLYLQDPRRYSQEHMIPQMKELVEKYCPSLLFTDGEWEQDSEVWSSCRFLDWLFNESPVKEEIVVNDRWGKDTRSLHGGYWTTEYGEVSDGKALELAKFRKWEENRSIGASFGFNRNEDMEDYMGEDEMVHLLIDTVSKGGNLHLNVGPTAEGTIPVIMQERLLYMGEWLKINGEAIYGTKMWKRHGEGDGVRFTQKDGSVYVICMKHPRKELTFRMPEALGQSTAVRLLGWDGLLKNRVEDGLLRIEMPPYIESELPWKSAYVFKVDGLAQGV